ncbi:MAG: amino acid ABC transporter permease [Lachnospiraceae bacterium]
MTLNWSLVFDKLPALLNGCLVTMELSILTLFFGTLLGIVLALMRDSSWLPVRYLAQFYIWIWRGTPLMVQAFLIYFGLPNLGITFSAMTAGVLSMSLNTGAYIAEIVRSGIHAIDPGQREAAKALGMNSRLELSRIVAPQAMRICLLPMVNQLISTIKNTSILSAITLTELTRQGTLIAYNSFHYFEPYIAVAVLYLLLTTIFTVIAGIIERRME